ncbi:DUF92 domain-containing protein [Bacillus sp. KH172YL63]|uniref:DUF92 domain-containing protein n=1 Tax=Bacillus sp. KH172YL63 TaxID=2709784 RepID=UPI0015642E56|nr:DUF92 domain-containing protein [Bacillus sp. KH172YL63]
MGIDQLYLLIFISAVAWGGWRTAHLRLSGAWMAVVVGVIIGYAYGVYGLIVLGVFFLSSSLWSRLFQFSKIGIDDRLAKTASRDWQQVLANGGPAALFALFFTVTGEDVWTYAFVAAIAGANADTWASEIGPLSRKLPLSLRTFKRVPKGTSGAVSVIGTCAALLGAAFISITAALMLDGMTFRLFLWITLAGFLGNLMDTFLGATVQLAYRCKVCGMQTEATRHCERQTIRTKGYGMNNEVVNALSSMFAGVIMLCVYW